MGLLKVFWQLFLLGAQGRVRAGAGAMGKNQKQTKIRKKKFSAKSGIISLSMKKVSRKFPGNFQEIFRKFPGNFRIFSGNFKVSGNVVGVSGNIPETFKKVVIFSGNFPENYRKITGNFPVSRNLETCWKT